MWKQKTLSSLGSQNGFSGARTTELQYEGWTVRGTEECFRLGKLKCKDPWLNHKELCWGWEECREVNAWRGPDYPRPWDVWSSSWERWLLELSSIKVTSDLVITSFYSLSPGSILPKCVEHLRQWPWVPWSSSIGSSKNLRALPLLYSSSVPSM